MLVLVLIRIASYLAALGFGVNFGVSVGKSSNAGLGVVAGLLGVVVLLVIAWILNNWMHNICYDIREWNRRRRRGF
jgi:ABC-type proline/glycine betaine transport system permease subunit